MTFKDRVKSLIDILEKSKVNDLEVSSFWGFRKIKLSQSSVKSDRANTSILKKEEPVEEVLSDRVDNTAVERENKIIQKESSPSEKLEKTSSHAAVEHIKAPLVGTVYLSSKPDEPAFVKVGDSVKEGQVVCIIEAMKIFNDIEADKNGVVSKILIKNEDPVEFGQELFEISSSD